MLNFKEPRTIQLPSGKALAAVFNPGGTQCAVGDRDGVIHIIDVASGEVIQRLRQHIEFVYCLQYLPGNNHLLSAGKDKSIREWDVESGKLVRDYAGIFSASAPTGHVAHGLKPATRSHRMTILSLAVAPDGDWMATGSQDNTLKLWQNGDPVRTFDWHTAPVTCVRFQPETQTLFSASRDKTIRSWSATNGAVIHRYNGHPGEIIGLEFIDRNHFVSVDDQGYVYAWEPHQEFPVAQIFKTTVPVCCATLDSEKNSLILGCARGQIEVVDVNPDNWESPDHFIYRCEPQTVHETDVRCVAVADSGNVAATGDNSGKRVLWASLDGGLASQEQSSLTNA